jgi:ABC-type sugar transport system permease subunit
MSFIEQATAGGCDFWRFVMRFLTANKRIRNHDSIWGLLFVAIPVLSVIFFVFLPALFSIYISMIEWNGYIPIEQATFIGLKNFAAFLTSGGLYTKEFLNSLFVTIVMMLYIPFNIVISFLLAFVLNRKGTYMKNSLRLIYFLPFVSSAVAITLVFKNLFDINGVINTIFAVFGFGDVEWLRSPGLSRAVIITMLIWRNIGYTMLMYLAGLQAIPNEIYEAAKIDGAGVIKRITKITLPSLKKITFFLVVTNVISGFQIYTESAILFQNSMGKGPINGTESMMVFLMYIYSGNDLGMASAISWAITVLILFATFLQFMRKRNDE